MSPATKKIKPARNKTVGSKLRRNAEKKLAVTGNGSESPTTISPENIATLVHELQVHQVELEMQNEELRRTQTELEKALDKYLHLYDFAPVAYLTVNEKGMIQGANLTAATILGMDRGALIKKPFTRFIHKEDQDINYRHHQKLVNTGEPLECDLRMVKKDGTIFRAHLEAATARDADGAVVCRFVMSDITERKFQEEERELTAALVLLVNTPGDFRDRMSSLTASLQNWTGCEAVGIRLRAGDDYPYYETRGFPAAFVYEENRLCAYDRNGQILHDSNGDPVLECMCGNILSGRFDPDKPFFTTHGSFWTNSTSALLAGAADLRTSTRNRCNSEGYESVALIPLRDDHQIFGLLQFNDRRPDRFTPDLITHLERMAANVSTALSRIQTTEALYESERLYHSLFENMLNGFAYCRVLFEDGKPRDFIYLAVNEAFGALTGLQNVIGRKITEVIPGIRETDPQLFEIYGRVAVSGRPERFEMFVESMQIWFSVSVYSPVREHFVAVFDVITELKEIERKRQRAQDELEERVKERTLALTISNQQLLREIEERQEAEAQLLKNKQMLQSVFDGISDPLVLLDEEMRVKMMNKRAVEYYGLTEPWKVIGEFCYQAFKGKSDLCKGCKVPVAILKTKDTVFEREGFMDPLLVEKVCTYSGGWSLIYNHLK